MSIYDLSNHSCQIMQEILREQQYPTPCPSNVSRACLCIHNLHSATARLLQCYDNNIYYIRRSPESKPARQQWAGCPPVRCCLCMEPGPPLKMTIESQHRQLNTQYQNLVVLESRPISGCTRKKIRGRTAIKLNGYSKKASVSQVILPLNTCVHPEGPRRLQGMRIGLRENTC